MKIKDHTIRDNILKCIRICLTLLCCLGFAVALSEKQYNVSLCFLNVQYILCVGFCINKLRRRIVQLFFYITLWVFLISRPTISMFRGDRWWHFTDEAVIFAVLAIFISQVFIYLGTVLFERLLQHFKYYEHEHTSQFFSNRQENDFNNSLKTITFIIFWVTFAFSMLSGIELLSFMSTREYTDYYISYKSSLPSAVRFLGDVLPYVMCIYLATLPKKLPTFFVLLAFAITKVPMLLIGSRNGFVLAAIFCVLYYITRDYLDGTKKWFSKFEKTCLIIAIPFVLLFLGYYNYSRAGTTFDSGPLELIVDFFYKQGVSFDVLCMAFVVLPILPGTGFKLYTFGTIIDYYGHNNIACSLFGATSLGEGNSELRATLGSTFSHCMSFVAHPNYLGGEGWGSSYLLETYADFGYIGIIVFSFLIGILMAAMIPMIKKNRLLRIIVLFSFTSFFLIARAEATDWLSFLFYTRFWFILIFCLLLAHIFKKNSLPYSAFNYKTKHKRTVKANV